MCFYVSDNHKDTLFNAIKQLIINVLYYVLLNLNSLENDNEKIKEIAAWIDKSIYADYKLFKTNYMAWDILNKQEKFADKYEQGEKEGFNTFIDTELQKLNLNLQEVRSLVLNIYANPVNQKFSISLQQKS